jgi:peptidoglycan/LPS O-acetylase OafA/YrhL
MIWLGAMSYSLYVWHPIFVNRSVDSALTAFPLNLILAFGCALLSFYFIERPFRSLKKPTVRPGVESPIAAASRLRERAEFF